MGLDHPALKFLLRAHDDGVSLERLITLGRQDLLVSRDALRNLLTSHQRHLTDEEIEKCFTADNRFADHLLGRLGARQLDAIDASSYEGSSIVHDLNRPIPESLHEQYTAVFDGGTLEHVFDFPRAIRNCMELVEKGGHVLSVVPCNNQLGHGLYQFSPELYFRVFSPENGYRVEKMYMCQAYVDDGDWYEVADPKDMGRRVELTNSSPMYLLCQARRKEIVPLFRTAPQQSDYAVEWDEKPRKGDDLSRLSFLSEDEPPSAGLPCGIKAFVRKFVPERLLKTRRDLAGLRAMERLDPDYFKRVE